MIGFTIRELTPDDLHPDLLLHFNRYQEVKRCLRKENDGWVLKDICFSEQWDKTLKEEIVAADFSHCLNSGGNVWGAFNQSKELIAFASLSSRFFGNDNEYLQLTQIHTSYEYRNKGVGKALFKVIAQKAKDSGAKKLYISTHSSEESQMFYSSIGCVDALEINKELAELEPCDRQMEFVL